MPFCAKLMFLFIASAQSHAFLLQFCKFLYDQNVSLDFIFSFSFMATAEFTRDLCTPAFIVDLDIVKRNAQAMHERFQKLGVQLRPHMKTHKTL